jgi:hypothetical protein
MIDDLPPEHMDRWTRNERLYRHLLSLGLVVVPMFADDDRARIDHLWVSIDLPEQVTVLRGVPQETAVTGVVPPLQGTQMRGAIGARAVTAGAAA